MAFFKRIKTVSEELPVNYEDLEFWERRDVRHAYMLQQNGQCWYCQAPLAEPCAKEVRDRPLDLSLFPQGFFNSLVHLHHDHDTEMTIGAVHAYCNAVLWQYEGE